MTACVDVGVEAGDQLVVGIRGSYFSHCESSVEKLIPPTSSGWDVPVERTSFTSRCIPTVV